LKYTSIVNAVFQPTAQNEARDRQLYKKKR